VPAACRPDPDHGAETLPPASSRDEHRTIRITSDLTPAPVPAAEPLDTPAPPAGPRRQVAIPAVLLTAGALALAGLAAPSGAADTDSVRLTAAAQTSALLLSPTAAKRLDLLDGPAPKAAVAAPAKAKPAAPRATRSRTVVKKKPVVRDRYCRPNGGGISSNYGPRWGRMHKGVDFDGSYGSPIRAVAAGRVVSAGYDGGYGKMVTIRHSDGTVTAYAHMSRIAVESGRVEACEVIGYVGSTGNSTGPHLHFEVRIGGGTVSPLRWLRQHGVRV
jgi:murein DD-endopeptidase MepM/ murein hydrolase activator NlpD